MEETELKEKLKYEKEVSFQVDIYSHTAQFSYQLYKLQAAHWSSRFVFFFLLGVLFTYGILLL